MSSSALMNVGTRAMMASQAQLQTTGHNISNAGVEGYSRQSVVLTTTSGVYSGAGFIGRGVSIETVNRAVNSYLTDLAAQTGSVAASDQARADALSQLQSAFGTGTSGIGYAATQLLNAFSDLSTTPGDLSSRQVVLSRARDLASLFSSTSDQIESIQKSIYSDVKSGAETVNGLAKQVAALNDKISTYQGTGHDPNDLLDQRDQLISQISQYVQVSRLPQEDGSINLFVAGGQSLVLGNTAYTLQATPNTFEPSKVELSIKIGSEVRSLDAESLGGGLLAGQLAFQADDLSAMRAELGRLAATLGDAINERQSLGLDLTGSAGGALFNFGNNTSLPAAAAPSASNARDASGNFIGSVTLTVNDRTALQASDYELREDPATPGTYQLTRLSDGEVTSGIVDGSTVDGFTIQFGSPGPQSGDRFLLKPVSTAAQLIQINQSDPRSLAAANPVTATPTPTNTGTGAVGSVTITAAPSTAYQAMKVVFTSSAGDYELRDSAGAVLSSGTWSAARSIDFNGIELTLNGAPAVGDSFSIDPTVDVKTSNGNALAFSALASEAMVGDATFTDAFANVLAGLGARVQSGQSAADTSAATATNVKASLSADTGVNLDEEAAKLIQYQQAYQAAAKILTVAQKVFDTLLSLGS